MVQDADVIGGTGDDLVTYRNSSAASACPLDGQFNDGNRGKENIRPDFEHIEGSNGIDTLTGSDDPNKIEQFTGVAGNDTIEGLGGTDFFNEGTAPNGADNIQGQSGIDRVNYAERTTAVTVDMVEPPAQQRRGR